MNLELGVVTVWYHGSENIGRFVANHRRISEPGFVHVHVINQLESAASQELRSAFPGGVFIDTDDNIGTSGAWNRGIALLLSRGVNAVGIWNPDVELADDCLLRLATTLFSDKTIGAVCPLLFFSGDRDQVQSYGCSIDPDTGGANHDYRGVHGRAGLPPWRDAGYLDGGTMMMKAEAIHRAGVFDEELFVYGEDADICIRVRKSGFRTVAVRDALAWHFGKEHREDGPPQHEIFYLTRNRFYLVRKHGRRFAWTRLLLRSIWQIPRRCLSYVYHGDYRLVTPLWAGAFCGVFGMMGKRGWVK